MAKQLLIPIRHYQCCGAAPLLAALAPVLPISAARVTATNLTNFGGKNIIIIKNCITYILSIREA